MRLAAITVVLAWLSVPVQAAEGAFVGIFGGYGWGQLDGETSQVDELAPAGGLLGVNAGVNFTLSDGLVVGVVGDAAIAGMVDNVVFSGTVSGQSEVDWLASIRGRVGFDAGTLMPYLTAGMAVAHHTIEQISTLPTISADAVHVGWTAGAGLEVAATDELSIDLLYRYSDYGSANYDVGGDEADIALTAHQVSVGINFGF